MKKVVLTSEALEQRGMFVPSIAEVEVPELNALLKLKKGQVAVVKVQQLSLDGFLKAKMEVEDYTQNLVEGVLEAVADRKDVKAEIDKALTSQGPAAKYRIAVVEAALVEPKLKHSDIVYLASLFPMVILRIMNKAMELTNKGASLKKNS